MHRVYNVVTCIICAVKYYQEYNGEGSVKLPYAVSKMIAQSSMALVLTPLKDISKQDTLFSIIYAWHYNIGKNFQSYNF